MNGGPIPEVNGQRRAVWRAYYRFEEGERTVLQCHRSKPKTEYRNANYGLAFI
jgi:hypothetical protein